MNNTRMKNNRQSHIYKNRGFTLVEALIAFFILSIGMLGIASLQTISLKAGKTSVYGSVATMKVDELFESMRANLSANPNVLLAYEGAGSDKGCIASDCKPLALAQEDVYWWKKNLKAGLPGAAVSTVVVTPAVAPSKMATVKISISWDERKQNAVGSDNKTYEATSYVCFTEPC